MSQTLGEKFIALSSFEKILVITIKVHSRKDIAKVVQAIDDNDSSQLCVYFAYELLDVRPIAKNSPNDDNAHYCQLVTNYVANLPSISEVFSSVPRCHFISLECM